MQILPTALFTAQVLWQMKRESSWEIMESLVLLQPGVWPPINLSLHNLKFYSRISFLYVATVYRITSKYFLASASAESFCMKEEEWDV